MIDGIQVTPQQILEFWFTYEYDSVSMEPEVFSSEIFTYYPSNDGGRLESYYELPYDDRADQYNDIPVNTDSDVVIGGGNLDSIVQNPANGGNSGNVDNGGNGNGGDIGIANGGVDNTGDVNGNALRGTAERRPGTLGASDDIDVLTECPANDYTCQMNEMCTDCPAESLWCSDMCWSMSKCKNLPCQLQYVCDLCEEWESLGMDLPYVCQRVPRCRL